MCIHSTVACASWKGERYAKINAEPCKLHACYDALTPAEKNTREKTTAPTTHLARAQSQEGAHCAVLALCGDGIGDGRQPSQTDRIGPRVRKLFMNLMTNIRTLGERGTLRRN